MKDSIDVDYVIGADGANSRVAKAIDAGEYNYAIAFQERIKVSDEKMKFYEELAEMYVGDDVSPDFYGWVFPKYDHVGVGTGTVVNRPAIKQYQKAMRDRCAAKIEGGKIIKVEAHPIPEHMRYFNNPFTRFLFDDRLTFRTFPLLADPEEWWVRRHLWAMLLDM